MKTWNKINFKSKRGITFCPRLIYDRQSIEANHHLGLTNLEKFAKLSKICFSMECFLVDFSQFFKGTVMQIEKAQINELLRASKIFWEFGIPTIYNFAVIYPWNFLKRQPTFYQFLLIFLFANKSAGLNNLSGYG